MGDSKNFYKAFAPLWGWPEDKDDAKKQWKEFKSTMEGCWETFQKIQQADLEARKEYWNKIFPMIMEMQDKAAAALPEKLPTLPGMPESTVKTQEVVDKVKEIQEMANKHMMEQADSVIDLVKQGQQKAKEAVEETVKNIEKNLDNK